MNDWQTIYNLIKVIQTWGNCWECFPGKYLVGRLWCNPIFRHCRRKPIKRDLLPRQPPTGSQEIILLHLSIFLEIAQELYQADQLILFFIWKWIQESSSFKLELFKFKNFHNLDCVTFLHLMQLRHFWNKTHLDNYVFISVTILRFYCQSCGW